MIEIVAVACFAGNPNNCVTVAYPSNMTAEQCRVLARKDVVAMFNIRTPTVLGKWECIVRK